VRIAYVGDFLNHGKSLQTIGTAIVFLLSTFENIDKIDVYCPIKDDNEDDSFQPNKVFLHESYRYDDSFSFFSLRKIPFCEYDTVIFNILPTGFGSSSIANMLGLLVPLYARYIKKCKNIRVIYHNSAYTNDIEKLGYNSYYDRIRAFVLRIVEKRIFKSIPTFFFLELYKQRIDDAIGKNLVKVLNARYFEAIATVFLNNSQNLEFFNRNVNKIPVVLLHGSWGPQKNLELGLETMRKLKENGLYFHVIISGGINHHFPGYEKEFYDLLNRYKDVVDEYLGRVPEKGIMELFLRSDVVLLPYNTPGGHSGVLEQAMFFEVPTVAINFPEYREQSKGEDFVRFAEGEKEFLDCVRSALVEFERRGETMPIPVKEKIKYSENNVRNLIG